MKKLITVIAIIALAAVALFALKQCKSNGGETTPLHQPAGPDFCADSAFAYCKAQCDFGPRTMNSAAHDSCGAWIAQKFRALGLTVEEQRCTLTGYDGTQLRATNIIAHYRPDAQPRTLLCAHWDSRPWADNDPNEENWRKPVMAANDGASGVAVLLELARIIVSDGTLQTGIDFVCFDAEDWGTPQWSDNQTDADVWALGSAYWAESIKDSPNKPRIGILLDMVGGQGAQFFQEGISKMYAMGLVNRVWQAAQEVGYGSLFPIQEGGTITDDHLAVNQVAGIPTIDIIPYYPDCQQSSFGPTWHTVSDDISHIDPNTLKAVGQTIVQTIYTE